MATRYSRAIVRRLLDEPGDRVMDIMADWPSPAFLDSGSSSQFGGAGRYQILTAWPRIVFEAQDTRYRLLPPGKDKRWIDSDPLRGLGLVLGQFDLDWEHAPPDPEEPPFQGGFIGYFGYDAGPLIEPCPRQHPRDSRLPDIRLGLYDTAVIIDLMKGRTELWAWDLAGEGELTVKKRATQWQRLIARSIANVPHARQFQPVALQPTIDRAAYLRSVERALEYISAGDVYQVNLARRFEARGVSDPYGIFRRLRKLSPAPFSAYLAWDDLAVISASPEWFYQTRGDLIITRPIKGTRPRGRDLDEDERLAAELRASAKDHAELVMIVDLERNDLGRVCEFRSVEVVEACRIESYAQVHHQVATISGRLRRNVGPVDVIRALFPGGSITGAPKIRAMQIIDELEPCRRSVYTGSIGYLSWGASAFNIAIRTIAVEGDRACFHVGGGIVADSVPEQEHEETLSKGRGLRTALVGEATEWHDP